MEMTAVSGKPEQENQPAGAEETARRARHLKAKNLTLLAVVMGFVVLVYFVSIVRMGGS